MSTFEFKLPDIGEGVMEGEIVAWLVTPGQPVREDEPMVEVMTDKATVTIGAPKTGTVKDVLAKVGQVVPVGSIIVTLDLNGSSSAAPTAKPPPARAEVPAAPPAPRAEAGTIKHAVPPPAAREQGPAATAVGDIREDVRGASLLATATKPAPSAPQGAPLATPATRKLARELDVDLRAIAGSGDRGRVTNEDVRRFHAMGSLRAVETRPTAIVGGHAPVQVRAEGGLEDRKPFVGVRRKIAERMQRAKNTAAHFTFVEECDVGRLKDVRARLTPIAQEQGVKLTFLPFIVKAVVASLRKHPILNSALDEATNELVQRRYYHIGVATATDQGLLVPVVRDADRKTIVEIGAEVERLSAAARAGKIAPADLTGSTFTITSLGKYGGLLATPILNLPEVGILGVHQIKERPVVRDGQIVIGEIMLLSLSFDHRIVDGHIGAAFAYEVISYLEQPERFFLEMV